MKRDNRYCLICQPRNRTIYFHQNEDGKIWLYCNKCDRGYSLSQYCEIADIDMADFMSGDFHMQEAKPDEVTAMAWPHNFIPLSDPRASLGIDYIKSRNLNIDGDMYYDLDQEGIVFPYYVENYFCGAQVRFINARIDEDGKEWKVTTLPGTRIGLLFYGWNQTKFMAQVKGIIVTEGAFNSLAIQQALNEAYGGVSRNAWRVIACSGSGLSDHQAEELRKLKEQGYKVIGAPDTDEAGFKMLNKMKEKGCITHYIMTGDTSKDWNDLAKEMSHKDLAKFVIKSITPIDVN